MMTRGYATPGTPEFCTMSETTICTEYESKYSCCCQDTISEWQNCIAQQELSPLMNISPPCTVSCNSKDGKNSGSGGSGSSLGLVIVILLLLLIVGGGVGGFFFYRRRRNSNGEKDDNDNNEKKKEKKKSNGNFLFGRSLGNDSNPLSNNGSDDVDVDENARKIDKGDDNDQKRNKKDKKKKMPNSGKNKKKKTKKNKKDELDNCSTDIEEGLSMNSISGNDDEGGDNYDNYNNNENPRNQDYDHDEQLSRQEQIPLKSYRMKLRNDDDDNADDYDDDGYSKGNGYCNNNNNNGGEGLMIREEATTSVRTSRARDRKYAIKAWNESQKNGSNRSLRSFGSGNNSQRTLNSEISSLGSDDLDTTVASSIGMEPLQQHQGRNNDDNKKLQLPSTFRLSKKISSRELKSIVRNHEESSRRMGLMEDEMENVIAKLNGTNRVTEDLTKEKLDQQRRIKELEAQNEKLRSELSSTRNLAAGGGGSSHGGYNNDGSSHNRRSYSRQSSRSKRSVFREIHMNDEQEDAEGASCDNNLNNSSIHSRTRSRSRSRRSLTKSVPSSRSLHRSKSRERLSRGVDRQASMKRRSASRSTSRDPLDCRSSSRRNLNASRSRKAQQRGRSSSRRNLNASPSMEAQQRGSPTLPNLSSSYRSLSRSSHGRGRSSSRRNLNASRSMEAQ